MATTRTTTPETTATSTRSIWIDGIVAGPVAGAATTVAVLVADAFDVGVATRNGEEIPLFGFAQMTVIGGLIGVLLAVVLRRRAARPQRTFVVTTVALTALTFIPDALFDAVPSTKVLLMTTHVIAAAIIIPTIARRLPARRG